ncbi:MAG: phosphatidylserine decarboxylase family protein [Bacteroidota bacterium]|nr:phosphatidylserine decarboxylase family protein [Bacteroidota bacterium]
MRIHKEGRSTLGIFLIAGSGMVTLAWLIINTLWICLLISLIVVSGFSFTMLFFRSPERAIELLDNSIIAPADGLVVAIQEEDEAEFFKDKRIKVSIFMSGADVHINWMPVSGEVSYFRYFSGKHLFARNPKSSHLNEHTSIGIKTTDGNQLLIKQIAGIMARRVVSYVQPGQEVFQGEELGFIKLGSRVDLFLPINTQVSVSTGQIVSGRQTVLAKWPESC